MGNGNGNGNGDAAAANMVNANEGFDAANMVNGAVTNTTVVFNAPSGQALYSSKYVCRPFCQPSTTVPNCYNICSIPDSS
jgi:hypothetical protein